jgi:cyclopropane-fatty-acyl-phospholipid synthase
VSQAQFSYAEELIAREGLGERITLLLEDYRDLRDRYDKLVSIEMIEAVGWRDFPTFFERCSALLDPAGTMLLQAITIDDRAYEVEKYSASFIRQVIFPDGCLPSVNVISSCLTEETDMSLIGLEDISAHYVRTLRSWRENLEHHADELRRRGFDAKFQRLWRLYLAYCEAGFAERRIRDVQMLMAKPAFRAEPIIEYRKLESRDSIPRDSVHRMNFEQVGSSRFARGQAGGDSDPVAR